MVLKNKSMCPMTLMTFHSSVTGPSKSSQWMGFESIKMTSEGMKELVIVKGIGACPMEL
jgi:hypothetical protein